MDFSEAAIVALPVKDACRALGIGKSALYKLIAAGRLDARRLGARTVITRSSIERLVASLPPAPVGPARGGQKCPRRTTELVP